MSPLVSILIPAYNAEKWIAQTIRSALSQSWHRKEIIIVDDGSRDDTVSIARKFASPNVFVTAQENRGASAARNAAFKLCQGDYIQWLDADDLLAPDKISRQIDAVAKCEQEGLVFSSAWAWFFYRPSKAQFQATTLWCDLPPGEWLFRKMDQNLHMQTATWLVSRKLTEAAGPWDTRLSLDDDGEYFCRVLLASTGVCFVKEAKVFYRAAGSDRLSKINRSNSKLESQFLSMQLHINYLRSLEDSPRARSACVRYLQTWCGNFIGIRPDIFRQMQQLAQRLGGELKLPPLGWKYRMFQRLFGFATARRIRGILRDCKWRLVALWDRVLSYWERRTVRDPVSI